MVESPSTDINLIDEHTDLQVSIAEYHSNGEQVPARLVERLIEIEDQLDAHLYVPRPFT